MLLLRRLLLAGVMRAEGFRAAGMAAVRMQVGAAARRRFRSILKDLIFRTFRAAVTHQQESSGGFGGSFRDIFSGMFTGETVARVGLSRGLTLSIR